MNEKLKLLIESYLSAVNEAIELLDASGIALPKSNMEWAASGISLQGELKGGVKYFKHGYGCAVRLSSGPVDFDFGANGEYNGFDEWRLCGFLQSSKSPTTFKSESELKQEFRHAIENGELIFSGYILYFLSGKNA
ncbi:hypothetical protein GCM10011613_01690 [Cellvibrio zantedeschiae]|uniref:DUF6896 domain-containing protein n=1 Tax=Cellvibrio zantedeschiae TaxID=1237077 RepID=A0ABQ3ANN5_9GAMM|nr:hypothetical protein [Cellvibrio zantedeschiae]GGY61901.1 hypothetical protein GCM10011613_01690 [Cellvibrio zantedeschiae]